MADRGRGGARTPNRPAAVSGPGAHSQRTDGGPSGTANMAAPGGTYGSRAALEAQQSAAPVPTDREAGGGGAPAAAGPPPPSGVFGPSQRPDEPITAGTRPVDSAPDTDMALRAIYQKYPSPYIARLLLRQR